MKKMIIAIGSCNGEEELFKNWMAENYPEIDIVIENTDRGGLYEYDQQFKEWVLSAHENYFEQFCCI